MNRPRRIAVQHCVLATLARQHASRPVFDLLEVAYEVSVPPDTEFPRIVARFDLFLRIVARRAGATELRIRVRRRVRRGEWELVNDFYSPGAGFPFPANGTVVFSQPIRLPNVKLTGEGLYAICVYFRPHRQRWSARGDRVLPRREVKAMSARRHGARPPASAEHVVGELFEFSPADDLANPGASTAQLKPVELTPVGTPAGRTGFLPADDKLTEPEGRGADEEPKPTP